MLSVGDLQYYCTFFFPYCDLILLSLIFGTDPLAPLWTWLLLCVYRHILFCKCLMSLLSDRLKECNFWKKKYLLFNRWAKDLTLNRLSLSGGSLTAARVSRRRLAEHAHMKVCAWAYKWKRRALPYKQGCYSHVKMLLISWYFQGRQCCIQLACFSRGKRPMWLFVQALGFSACLCMLCIQSEFWGVVPRTS